MSLLRAGGRSAGASGRGVSGVLVAVLALAFGAGCTQQAQSVTLRSLESSSAFAFLCVSTDYSPRDIDDCPDTNPVDGEERHMLTLVTQATRGEVAVVDLTTGDVIDDEPTIPGFNFLPVGAKPRAIASTPGSVATFVGVAEVGKEGIFALPTSCLAPREADERMRDLTVWPACRLPAAPGEMSVLVDHPVDGDGDPATPPASRCVSSFPTATSEEIESRQCPADLSLETENPGRRLLAVTLPTEGQIAIIDAQALLDRAPGSFDPCPIEKLIQLRVDLPAERPLQKLPPDLDLPGATRPVGFPREPVEGYEPRPAGLALVDDPRTGEEIIYLADQGAPVIHVLDARNPCALEEKEPLLPMSFMDPVRSVTTKKLAASPLTTDAKRYLYAIDEFDNGSVMIFDVSQGATDRTPLLRPRSALMTFEAPDRIAFDAPAKDVTFALRDRVEVDPATGSQRVGVFCDPDPGIDVNSPPARYRPNADLSEGAAPSQLRGLYGFLALSSGSIAVIDVEDFDAPCRRPSAVNASKVPDFRGCAGDPEVDARGEPLGSYTLDPANPESQPTVTNELSCNVVEPHRSRSVRFVLNDRDVGSAGAPSLRALPRLLSDTGRSLPNDDSEEGRKNPKLLAVDFGDRPEDRAQVYVGGALYDRDSLDNPLVIDPAVAEQNSLVLDMTEPRAYASIEQFTTVFEGPLFDERPAAYFRFEGGQASLVDSGVVLCDRGVEDASIATLRGRELGVAEENLATFAGGHADYVRITSDLLEEDNAYWSGAGATCGGASPDVAGAGFLQCRTLLGTRKAMREQREFTVTEASSDTLKLTPRYGNEDEKAFNTDLVACCFPQAVSYEVRASKAWVVRGSVSGYRHDLRANPETRRCERDTSPLRSQQRGRAYEVSCAADPTTDCAQLAEDGLTVLPRSIGLAGPDDVACVVRSPNEIKKIGDSPCVFRGPTSIFVVYRGQNPSERDWNFGWELNSGFSPLFVNLAAANDPNTNPQSMVFSKQLGDLVVADGASRGIVLIDLSTFQSTFLY